MKRPNIIEEIKRFHEISGNKNIISEDFLDDLLKKVGLKSDEKDVKKIDDPKKADLVSDDVKQFYSTLENVKSDLNQQSAGNYKFQKDVESVQIGLMILGYDLPKHGVDGKYGPETASAISKFKKDNNFNLKI
jgi:peptidoglycan hydrolase-like protein with peptidoglycan-binding domain